MNLKKLVGILVITLAGAIGLTSCSILHSGPYAEVHMKSAHYLNPDINGRPSPVVVTIYQLKSSYAFQQADYNTLSRNSAQVLGGDLLDKTTVEVRPNDTKKIKVTLSPNAKYLGIVAAYRNVNNGKWHSIIKLTDSAHHHTNVMLNLESQGFTSSMKVKQNLIPL